MIYAVDWDNDGQTRAKIVALNRWVDNEFYANDEALKGKFGSSAG